MSIIVSMKKFLSSIVNQNSSVILKKIAISIVILVLMWLTKFFINKIVKKQTKSVKIQYKWRKITNYVITTITIFVIGKIWFNIFQTITTFLGLVSAGIAIALKDLLLNIAGWVYIISRKPFDVGDRVQIKKFSGDVIDTGIFEFSLLEIRNWVKGDQSTGRIIHIPNGKILTEGIYNYTKEFNYIWDELPILLTFESNWKKAKKILNSILKKHFTDVDKTVEKQIKQAANKLMIKYEKLTPIIYTSVEESGILLTLRFLCQPRNRRTISHTLWEEILNAFGKNKDINFAYPTQRIYLPNIKKSKLEVTS